MASIRLTDRERDMVSECKDAEDLEMRVEQIIYERKYFPDGIDYSDLTDD